MILRAEYGKHPAWGGEVPAGYAGNTNKGIIPPGFMMHLPFKRIICLWLLAVLLLFGTAAPARAGFFDTYGADARGMALGGAMAAVAEGWSSVYYNPAALALSKDIEFSVGLFWAIPELSVEYKQGPDEKQRQLPRSADTLDTLAGPAMGLLLPVDRLTPRKLPVPVAIVWESLCRAKCWPPPASWSPLFPLMSSLTKGIPALP